MSKRIFFKTTITVEVFSDGAPSEIEDVEDLDFYTKVPYSSRIIALSEDPVEAEEVASALSNPKFPEEFEEVWGLNALGVEV